MRYAWDSEKHRYANLRIRIWSLRIVTDLSLPETEREDIASDLWVHLLTQMERYDPSRSSPKTFISRVVLNKARDIFRFWWKGKNRRLRVSALLNEALRSADGDDVDHPDLPGEEEYEAARRAFMDEVDLLDERIDIARHLARLSSDLRHLCLKQVSEVAAEVAWTGRVPSRELTKRIRAIRRSLGLE